MSNKQNAGNRAEIQPGEVILHVPLTEVFVDYDWNSRSKKNVLAQETDGAQDTTLRGEHRNDGLGIDGLKTNMRDNGQDTAVILRKVEGGKTLGGKKTDRPYELVAGFRRYTAIEMLLASEEDQKFCKANNQENMVPNTANGTILAVVRSLTPLQARILNVRENTYRQNLDTPDLLGSVIELSKAKMSQTSIGQELGINQSYVSKLCAIGALPKAVISHWKGEGKIPGLPEAIQTRLRTSDLVDLYQATHPKDGVPESDAEVTKRYCDMLNPPPPPPGSAPAEKDAVLDRIKKAAALAAGLVTAGVLENGSLNWSLVIGPKGDGYLIDSGKIDAAGRLKYTEAAQTAFEDAIRSAQTAAEAKQAAKEEARRAQSSEAASS